MPKGFLVKRREGEMSALDLIPYRPWRDVTLSVEQEEPVDFSLRSRRESDGSDTRRRDEFHQQVRGEIEGVKDAVHGRVGDKGGRLLVRTPDSGFSSPSDGDLYRRSVCHIPSARVPPKTLPDVVASGEVEQTTPLALIKRKSPEEELRQGLHVSTLHDPPDPSHFQPFHLTIPRADDPRYLMPPQTSPYHLLSPTLYWPHGSSPLRSPIPFTSPLGRSPYDLSHTTVPLQSPQEGLNLTTRPPGSPRLVTPIKVPPKSPVAGVATPQKRKSPSTANTSEKKFKASKKTKAARRLNFDEDKTSPVSGTIIRELAEGEEPLVVRKGDIDPAYNVVEITEEAKAELAKIDNKIGDYVCRLCKEMYDDAFGLAQHRCSRIIHVEYRCPECDKVFNCPANLASHRRWHKPKASVGTSSAASTSTASTSTSGEAEGAPGKSYTENNNNNTSSTNNNLLKGPPALVPLPQFVPVAREEETPEEQYECELCFKKFKRHSYLRKHLATHRGEGGEGDGAGPSHAPHPPPLTPLLSPHFPAEVLPCHLCAAAFYTAAALELHLETAHLPKLEASTSTQLHVPRPQFSPRGHLPPQHPPPPAPPHLLHRPHQISAPT